MEDILIGTDKLYDITLYDENEVMLDGSDFSNIIVYLYGEYHENIFTKYVSNTSED